MTNVFEKLHAAQQNGRGVELTAADVELLWNVPGMSAALAKAETKYDRWRELFRELERIEARSTGEK